MIDKKGLRELCDAQQICHLPPGLMSEILDALDQFDTPEVEDFLKGVQREAPHQLIRWGQEHDDLKSDFDWLFLFGFLAGKAMQARKDGNLEKAKHHAITAGAALMNWHTRVDL